MKKKSHARPRYIMEAERNRVQGNRVISVWKVRTRTRTKTRTKTQMPRETYNTGIYINFKIAVATWATTDSNLVAQPNFWVPSIN